MRKGEYSEWGPEEAGGGGSERGSDVPSVRSEEVLHFWVVAQRLEGRSVVDFAVVSRDEARASAQL